MTSIFSVRIVKSNSIGYLTRLCKVSTFNNYIIRKTINIILLLIIIIINLC